MLDGFSDLLLPELVFADLSVNAKKALLATLGTAVAKAHALDTGAVGAALTTREKLGSTGFGGGVALPHAKLEGLPRVIGTFARLATPLDYKAVDDLPVDLVFLLLSPTDAGADHLKALARVSRRLRDREFTAKLRGAASPDALFALLTGDRADGG